MKSPLMNSLIFIATILLGYLFGLFFAGSKPVAVDLPICELPVAKNKTSRGLPSSNVEFKEIPDSIEFPEYQDPKKNFIALDEDGIFRKSEVVAKNGENWLILVKKNGKFSLMSDKASVKNLKTTSWPGDESDAALSFSVAKTSSVLFAFKDIPNLRPGELKTVYEYKRADTPNEATENIKSVDFYLNGETTRLKTSTALNKEGKLAAVLALEQDGKKQILRRYYNSSDPNKSFDHNPLQLFGNVLWAGDLDNDGKLDLIIDSFNEIGATYIELFLSSTADEKSLVELTTSFLTQGC